MPRITCKLACTVFAAWWPWRPLETVCVATASAAYEHDGTLGTASGPAVGRKCYAVTTVVDIENRHGLPRITSFCK